MSPKTRRSTRSGNSGSPAASTKAAVKDEKPTSSRRTTTRLSGTSASVTATPKNTPSPLTRGKNQKSSPTNSTRSKSKTRDSLPAEEETVAKRRSQRTPTTSTRSQKSKVEDVVKPTETRSSRKRTRVAESDVTDADVTPTKKLRGRLSVGSPRVSLVSVDITDAKKSISVKSIGKTKNVSSSPVKAARMSTRNRSTSRVRYAEEDEEEAKQTSPPSRSARQQKKSAGSARQQAVAKPAPRTVTPKSKPKKKLPAKARAKRTTPEETKRVSRTPRGRQGTQRSSEGTVVKTPPVTSRSPPPPPQALRATRNSLRSSSKKSQEMPPDQPSLQSKEEEGEEASAAAAKGESAEGHQGKGKDAGDEETSMEVDAEAEETKKPVTEEKQHVESDEKTKQSSEDAKADAEDDTKKRKADEVVAMEEDKEETSGKKPKLDEEAAAKEPKAKETADVKSETVKPAETESKESDVRASVITSVQNVEGDESMEVDGEAPKAASSETKKDEKPEEAAKEKKDEVTEKTPKKDDAPAEPGDKTAKVDAESKDTKDAKVEEKQEVAKDKTEVDSEKPSVKDVDGKDKKNVKEESSKMEEDVAAAVGEDAAKPEESKSGASPTEVAKEPAKSEPEVKKTVASDKKEATKEVSPVKANSEVADAPEAKSEEPVVEPKDAKSSETDKETKETDKETKATDKETKETKVNEAVNEKAQNHSGSDSSVSTLNDVGKKESECADGKEEKDRTDKKSVDVVVVKSTKEVTDIVDDAKGLTVVAAADHQGEKKEASAAETMDVSTEPNSDSKTSDGKVEQNGTGAIKCDDASNGKDHVATKPTLDGVKSNGVPLEVVEMQIPSVTLGEVLRRKLIWNPSLDVPTVEALGPKKFAVVSYNLQGLGEVISNHEKLLNELKQLEPPILCVQDVDASYFESTLQPSLKSLGYSGIYRKTKAVERGIATMFLTSAFEAVEHKAVDVPELVQKDVDNSTMDDTEKEALTTYLSQSSFILFSKLRPLNSDKTICMCNANFPADDLSLHALQIAVTLRELANQSGGSGIPHILCGTFNLDENVPGYQILKNGNLSNETIEELQQRKNVPIPNKENAALVNLLRKCFQHSSSSLKSSYSTVLGDESKGAKSLTTGRDSVWFSGDSLHVVGVLDAASPTGDSDRNVHISLKAEFSFVN